jgi:uncharacterized protein YndB with AHSA1/START domain
VINQADITLVRKTITVDAPRARAFEVFTSGFDRWWFRQHHIGAAEMAEAVLECREGGRWYERGVDGSECEWGRVLVFEPPERLVLAWQINDAWQHDPELVTEVDVRFVAESPDRTRVELEHRHIDRMGDGAAQIHEALDSPGGWSGLLEAFKDAALG